MSAEKTEPADENGYESWPKLKASVDGVTIARFAEAVKAGDIAAAVVKALTWAAS